MKKRINKIRFKVIILFIIIVVTGCGIKKEEADEKRQVDSYKTEGRISANKDKKTENNENEIADEIDYSFYLKKTWIVDGWEKDERRRDYPISIIFTKIEGKYIEGYFDIEGMVSSGYYYFLNNAYREPDRFQGMLYAGTAECKYDDSNGRNGTFNLKFYDTDRIEVQLEDDETQIYLLRPYNLSNEEFRDYQVSYEIDLDSWGIVNMFYANSDNNHSLPLVFLTNEQGDILYDFTAAYQSDSEVQDIIIEDINGDGLKDVEVVTFFSAIPDAYRFEWYFYQRENGTFYLELTNMFGSD